MKLDVHTAFDEWGDEFDCRLKTVHSQGNVAKAEWINYGGHPYTGMFEGADTGFVRLSTLVPVKEPGSVESGANVMLPTISLKFMRDQMDSANAFGNKSFFGQTSYNFFENSLLSNLKEAVDSVTPADLKPFHHKVRPETNFPNSVGHSEFASYRQDGEKVESPVFPFSLRFEPNGQLSYEDEQYEVSLFDRLKAIEPNTMLYRVWARDKPASLGG